MDRCLECHRLVGSYPRRGLCLRCYRNPEVRVEYPPLPKGNWRFIGRGWDVMDDCLLTDLFNDGLSDREIAKQVMRSVGSVTKRRQRLGLKVSSSRMAAHRRRKK